MDFGGILGHFGAFLREDLFFWKSTGPFETKVGNILCYDEEPPTKQDGVWVMHN